MPAATKTTSKKLPAKKAVKKASKRAAGQARKTKATKKTTTANKGRTDKSWQFQKGKSGNPRGRPKKDYELALLAREYTKLALSTIKGIMVDDEAASHDRLRAAEIILDRGWGKAPMTIEVEGPVGYSEARMREKEERDEITELIDVLHERLGTDPDTTGNGSGNGAARSM